MMPSPAHERLEAQEFLLATQRTTEHRLRVDPKGKGPIKNATGYFKSACRNSGALVAQKPADAPF